MAVDYRSLILAHTAIQSYWRLGEASGATAADEKAAVAGTYNGTPGYGATGMIGADGNTAVTFSGDDYISLGDNYDFAATAAFSAEAWVKPGTQGASGGRIIAKDDGTNGWAFGLGASGTLAGFREGGGGFDTSTNATVLSTSAFSHVVLTYDGATMLMYLNGVLASGSSTASSRSLSNTVLDLRIGDRASGSRAFVGVIDEVALYNAALSAVDIAGHYAVGSQTFGTIGTAVPTTGQIWPRGSKA